jgi:hypothetical protein
MLRESLVSLKDLLELISSWLMLTLEPRVEFMGIMGLPLVVVGMKDLLFPFLEDMVEDALDAPYYLKS